MLFIDRLCRLDLLCLELLELVKIDNIVYFNLFQIDNLMCKMTDDNVGKLLI